MIKSIDDIRCMVSNISNKDVVTNRILKMEIYHYLDRLEELINN